MTWKAGDTIPLGDQTLRVVAVRDYDADQPPVLVVAELENPSTSLQPPSRAD